MPAAPRPTPFSVSQLKSRVLDLAQTSIYTVRLGQPPGLGVLGEFENVSGEDIFNMELSCNATNLPGSALATHDVTNDYPGVRERFAYRRIYDDTIDFTFYVDKEYKVVEYLDSWMKLVTGQGTTFSSDDYLDSSKYYRMNYPSAYRSDGLYITKFEKDTSSSMTYQFIGAFPINLSAMPVSYDASEILKCSVSYAYTRYIRTRNK